MPLALRVTETFFLRGSAFLIALGVNVVVSRALGPEGRGQYSLAILGALVLTILGKLGIEHANVYLLGTVGIDPDRLRRQNLAVAVVAGVPAVFLLSIAPVVLPAVFGDTPTTLLLLTGVTIPFAIHSQLAGGLQNLSGLTTWQFRALLAGGLLQLLLAGVLAGLGRLDVTTAVVSYVVATLTAWLLIVARDGWNKLRLNFEPALLARSLRYSLIVHSALVLLFLQTRLNLFMVKAFADTTAVGQYSLSVSLAEAFLLAADSLAIALLPQQTLGRIDEAARLGLNAAKVGGLLTGIALVPGIVLGPTVISLLFGPAFAPSYAPFAVLIFGMVFAAIQRYCGPPALRANDPVRLVRIYVLGVLTNLALNVWWIPTWGLTGAAGATAVSYALTALLFVRWMRELVGRNQVSRTLESR